MSNITIKDSGARNNSFLNREEDFTARKFVRTSNEPLGDNGDYVTLEAQVDSTGRKVALIMGSRDLAVLAEAKVITLGKDGFEVPAEVTFSWDKKKASVKAA